MNSEAKTHGVYLAGANVPPLSEFVDGAQIFAVWPANQYHSQVVALEDLGWEVRDCVKAYLFGLSYQIGLFRKPFRGTVVSNVIKNGCGGLNIDASRIESGGEHENWKPSTFSNREGSDLSKSHIAGSKERTAEENNEAMRQAQLESIEKLNTMGRFPANLILSPDASLLMDEQAPVAGNLFQAKRKKETSGGSGNSWTNGGKDVGENNGFYDAPSGASKFFAQVSNLAELKELLTRLVEPPSQNTERDEA